MYQSAINQGFFSDGDTPLKKAPKFQHLGAPSRHNPIIRTAGTAITFAPKMETNSVCKLESRSSAEA
jgi:hypothetical protein